MSFKLIKKIMLLGLLASVNCCYSTEAHALAVQLVNKEHKSECECVKCKPIKDCICAFCNLPKALSFLIISITQNISSNKQSLQNLLDFFIMATHSSHPEIQKKIQCFSGALTKSDEETIAKTRSELIEIINIFINPRQQVTSQEHLPSRCAPSSPGLAPKPAIQEDGCIACGS